MVYFASLIFILLSWSRSCFILLSRCLTRCLVESKAKTSSRHHASCLVLKPDRLGIHDWAQSLIRGKTAIIYDQPVPSARLRMVPRITRSPPNGCRGSWEGQLGGMFQLLLEAPYLCSQTQSFSHFIFGVMLSNWSSNWWSRKTNINVYTGETTSEQKKTSNSTGLLYVYSAYQWQSETEISEGEFMMVRNCPLTKGGYNYQVRYSSNAIQEKNRVEQVQPKLKIGNKEIRKVYMRQK